MKQPDGVPIQIGSYRMRLPVYKDLQTSQKIVARIEGRHAALRETAGVDTVAEALLMAYEFACEAYGLEEEQRALNTRVAARLAELRKRVNKIVEAHTPTEGDEEGL